VENELPPDPDATLDQVAVQPADAAPSHAPEVVPLATAAPTAVIPEVPVYPDRGTGLVVFGVAQIIMGLLAALMVPLAMLGAFMSRLAPGGGMRPGQYVSGIASYAFISIAFLGLGIGSVQMKRWAHALTLVTSWYWLIMGTLVTILLTAVLPVTMKSALQQAQQNTANAPPADISAGVMAVILTLIIVFIAFFLILVPIAFVVFYSRKDVAETCRRRDPVARWTDRTPIPVLGASVVLFTGALYLFLMGVTTPVFPFFGRYLTGIPGATCFLLLSALDTYLAIALFRLQSSGWWITFLSHPVRLLSLAITYARANVLTAYSRMGMSPEQLKILNSNPMFRSHVLLWWSLISMVLFVGYLIWLKRYFKAADPQGLVAATPEPLG